MVRFSEQTQCSNYVTSENLLSASWLVSELTSTQAGLSVNCPERHQIQISQVFRRIIQISNQTICG